MHEQLPNHFADLYAEMARAVLGWDEAPTSGIFLTPLDFRAIPGHALAAVERLEIPLVSIVAECSVLTFAAEDGRVSKPLDAGTLSAAVAAWPASRIAEWFGRDPERLFWHVPQVVSYQTHVPVSVEFWSSPTV